MDPLLPHRPNLEHLRSQAKTLLANLRNGSNEAAVQFQTHLPSAAELSEAEILNHPYRLADAQSVIARSSGFASWPALARHVETLRALEGTWEFQTMEIEGSTLPSGAFASSRLLIDGDRFRTESPEAIYEGIFNIDVEAEPAHLDIEFIEGPEAGNWSYAIFDLKGDNLTIAIGLTGAQRPTEFASRPNTGHVLETLLRIDPRRPQEVEEGVQTDAPVGAIGGVSESAVISGPELDQMQGAWIPVKIVRDGMDLPANFLKVGVREASGNRVTVSFGKKPMIEAHVKISPDRIPMEIDYLLFDGSIQFGIFKFVDEEVQFCFGAPGKDRPNTFDAPTGSGATFSHWKRRP